MNIGTLALSTAPKSCSSSKKAKHATSDRDIREGPASKSGQITRTTRATRVKHSSPQPRMETEQSGVFHSRLPLSALSKPLPKGEDRLTLIRTAMASLQLTNEEANALGASRTESSGQRSSETCMSASLPSDQGKPHNAISRPEGRPVVCSPEQLRLHRVLEGLDLIDEVGELNEAARLTDQSAAEPILITTSGIVLAGFGRWRLAIFEGRNEINCIEYPLSEDESLQFILTQHQTGRAWNAFTRIRVALTLEPSLQQRALANMRAGGKYKGSASLPEAQQIDVRQEIAHAAGVGARNVSNVKMILQAAHPRLIEALRNGTLSINRAVQWCRLPKVQQVEQFTRQGVERAANKVIRQAITRLRRNDTTPDALTLLNILQQHEMRQPGSVEVRVSRLQRTIVLVGQDLSSGPLTQRELKIT